MTPCFLEPLVGVVGEHIAAHTGAMATEDVEKEIAEMFDLSKKKKKVPKKKEAAGEDGDDDFDGLETGTAASSRGGPPADEKRVFLDASEGGCGDYSYEQMLDRIMDMLNANNPELMEKRRHTMKPPQLMRVGTKKTLWVNFSEICSMMHRNPEHVFQFFMAELGTEGSIDGTQRLVIRGKYVPKYIESLLRKYIVEYVTCQMCRSPSTTLTRDSVSRLFFIHCQDCGSSRSVAQIRAGFHAQTRADRRALRK